ncbi:MAG: hypothetical protein NT028_15435 [candidate division Zixibacteria bacterium]|nr:hypothetical protein [candidate division Zixibacteria bacterium]
MDREVHSMVRGEHTYTVFLALSWRLSDKLRRGYDYTSARSVTTPFY